MPCHVCECLAYVRSSLRSPSLPSYHLLVNGKVEKQLKYFVGAAWKAKKELGAYVMDKRFPRELDLVAFENREPRFWMELKCSFRQDRVDSLASAYRALEQTRDIVAVLDSNLKHCPGFIVHFVNSIPREGDPRVLLPDWVLAKFLGLANQVPIDTGTLVDIYGAEGHRVHGVIPISDDPHVQAVVAEVRQPNMGFLVDCDNLRAQDRSA